MLMFREILVKVCRTEGHKICGETASGHEAVELCNSFRPDLLLLDLRLPDSDGVEVAKVVRVANPQIKILAVSANLNDYLLYRLERRGIQGFVDKNIHTLADLRSALQAISFGRTWYSPSFQAARLQRLLDQNSFDKKLTDYEQAILCHIADGLSDGEISMQLGISSRTVQGHRSAIMRKLNIAGTPKLIAFAAAKGFGRHAI